MKEKLIGFFTPNKNLDSKSKSTILAFWIGTTILTWVFSGSTLIPSPGEVFVAFKQLIKEGYLTDLTISTWFCIKSMGYAAIISLTIAYLSVLPFFRPPVAFIARSRFLCTAGLTFLFMQLTPDVEHQKVAILVFAITVFVVTSACGVIASIRTDDLDYARTLKMNEWETTWEQIILGQMHNMLEIIRQNFAIAWMMLAMVESLCRAEGGIGVILTDKNKHFQMESVYAIQISVLIVGIVFDWALGLAKRFLCPASVITLNRK